MQDSSENRDVFKGPSTDKGQGIPEGWNIPKPEVIPSPTYWPFMLSFGAALMGLGILTSKLIGAIGIVVFIIAAARWVGELYHEGRQ